MSSHPQPRSVQERHISHKRQQKNRIAANLPKRTQVLIEGELTYREYSRTIESETGSVNVQWPVAEIIVESIKALDRKRKDANETEGAA